MSPSAMGPDVGNTLICCGSQNSFVSVTASSRFNRVEVLQPAVPVISPVLISIMPLQISVLPLCSPVADRQNDPVCRY